MGINICDLPDEKGEWEGNENACKRLSNAVKRFPNALERVWVFVRIPPFHQVGYIYIQDNEEWGCTSYSQWRMWLFNYIVLLLLLYLKLIYPGLLTKSTAHVTDGVDVTSAHVYFSPLSVDSRPIGRPTRSQPTIDRLSADCRLTIGQWVSPTIYQYHLKNETLVLAFVVELTQTPDFSRDSGQNLFKCLTEKYESD